MKKSMFETLATLATVGAAAGTSALLSGCGAAPVSAVEVPMAIEAKPAAAAPVSAPAAPAATTPAPAMPAATTTAAPTAVPAAPPAPAAKPSKPKASAGTKKKADGTGSCGAGTCG